MPTQIFISYAHEDKEFARQIEKALESSDYSIWRDETGLQHATLWNQGVTHSINNSRCVVLVWSSHAKKSLPVSKEITAAKALLKPIIPVHVLNETTIESLPEEIQDLQIIHQSDFEAIRDELLRRIKEPALSEVIYPPESEKLFIPYYRNKYFVGREDELRKLFFDVYGPLGRKAQNIPFIIRGMGGIGKTHLAVEFAYRVTPLYPDGIYWIDARGTDLIHAYVEISEHLGVRRFKNEPDESLAKRVLAYLNSQLRKSLLILDDVREKSIIQDWMPKGARACAVLITTRESLAIGADVMLLNELDEKAALTLLLSRRADLQEISTELKAAQQICHLIGNHPFAIEICAQYLESNAITATTYLTRLQAEPSRIAKLLRTEELGFIEKEKKSIFTSLNLSYNQLKRSEIDRYFFLLPHFATDSISVNLLQNSYNDKEDGQKVITELSRHSLISLDKNKQRIILHPLVRKFSELLQVSSNGKYKRTFVKLMAAFIEQNIKLDQIEILKPEVNHIEQAILIAEENQIWPELNRLYIYFAQYLGSRFELDKQRVCLDKALKYLEKYDPKNISQKMIILTELGKVLDVKAEYGPALENLENALELSTRQKEILPGDIGNIHFQIGNVHLNSGNFDIARHHYQEADVRCRKTYHPESRFVTRIIEAFARLESKKGNYPAAMKQFDRLGEIYKTKTGEEDRKYLAQVFLEQSQIFRYRAEFEPALKRLDEALKIFKEFYGEEHPLVADAYEVQVKIYYHQCKFDESLKVLNETLKIRKNVFGEKHPAVGMTLHDFGSYYLNKGDYKNAIEYLTRAIESVQDLSDKPLPQEVEWRIKLISAYRQQGDYQSALAQLETTNKIIKAIWGETDQRDTARLYMEFSHVYRGKAEFTKALDYIERSIGMKERIYGPNHPSVASSLELQGKIYYHLRDFEKLFPVLTRTLAIRKNAFGDSHQLISTTLHDFGIYYLRKGDYKTAIQYLKEALAMSRAVFKTDHPQVVEWSLELASAYREIGEYDAALTQLEETRKIAENIYSIVSKESSEKQKNANVLAEHPVVARMWLEFSQVYRRKSDFKKAMEYVEKSLEMKKAIYGTEHPSYAAGLEGQVKIYHHQCKFNESLLILKKILEIRENAFSEKHEDVSTTYHDFGSCYLQLGNFPEAINNFEKALKISRDVFVDNHPQIVERMLYLAEAFRLQSNYDQALTQLEETRKIAEKVYGKNPHPIVARMWLEFSQVHRRKGEFEKALEFVNKSLKMKEEIYGKEHQFYAEGLEVLVKTYHYQGKFDESFPILEDTLEIRKKKLGEDHQDVGTTLQDFGSFHLRKGAVGEAIKKFTEALKISRNVFNENHPQVAERRLYLAEAYRIKGEFDKALKELEKTQKITEAVYETKNHPIVARLWLEFSQAYRRKGDFEKALEYVNKSLKMKEDIYGKEHPSYAEGLEVKVKIYHHQCRFDESLPILEQTLNIRKKVYQDKHPDVSTTYHDFGSYYLKKGDYKNAIEMFKKALEIILDIFNANHPLEAERRLYLAEAYRHNGDYKNALDELEKTQKITETVYKTGDHPIVARMWLEFSQVNRRKGDSEKALKNVTMSLTMKEAIYGRAHASTAEALDVLAKLKVQLNLFGEARQLLDESREIKEKVYPENHPDIANTLHELGILASKQNQTKEALKFYAQAYEKRTAVYGEAHPEIGKLYMDMGILYRQMGEYATAKDAFEKALSIDTQFFTGDHPYLARVNLEMGILFKQKNDLDSARQYLEEAYNIFQKNAHQNYPEFIENANQLKAVYQDYNEKLKLETIVNDLLRVKTEILGKTHAEVQALEDELKQLNK